MNNIFNADDYQGIKAEVIQDHTDHSMWTSFQTNEVTVRTRECIQYRTRIAVYPFLRLAF